jgi:hypothetical protein
MTVIEVKPRKWGWCVFESPGVEPVFLQKDQAIGYAETRACAKKLATCTRYYRPLSIARIKVTLARSY